MLKKIGRSLLAAALAGSAILLAIILWLTTRTARALKFSTPDEIAAVFCASKKSLAAGAPMAALIFGTNPGLGLILLPIMIYHPLQLIVCSVMAESYASRSREEALLAQNALPAS